MNAPASPLVSVCIITYNHARYIAQCIESILVQETDFDFEIIIGENSSNDGTAEICATYAEKFPGKIRLLRHTREGVIFINGNATGRRNVIDTLAQVRGTFVALCEGDDYWTDPKKLQQQARFLEQHPDYSIACSRVKLVDEAGKEQGESVSETKDSFDVTELAARNFIYTTTVMYRAAHIRNIGSGPFLEVPAGDYFLHMLNARQGKIKLFPATMAAYRKHGDGIWAGRSNVFQWLGVIQTNYVLLGVFSDEPVVARALSRAMQDHIDFLFNMEGFREETAFDKITDRRFAELMRQFYHWHHEMLAAKKRTEDVRQDYEQSASLRLGRRITGLFRPFRKK